MHRTLHATLLAIAAVACTLAPASAKEVAGLHATIEEGGTKAIWSNSGGFKCQLISHIAHFRLMANKAAMVIDLLDNDKPIPITQFSFQIHYTPQIKKHVTPDVVIQYEDGSGKRMEERYTHKDMDITSKPGDRELWTKKYATPKKIRHIFVGGQESDYRKGYLNLTGALDFTFSDFTAISAQTGKEMSTNTNVDVRVIKRNEDPLLKLLTGSIDSEDPK